MGRGRWDGGELGRGWFLYVWILHKVKQRMPGTRYRRICAVVYCAN